MRCNNRMSGKFKNKTRKKVSSTTTCSFEPTFLGDNALQTEYFVTETPEQELIIYTLSMSDSNGMNSLSTSSSASSSNHFANALSTSASSASASASSSNNSLNVNASNASSSASSSKNEAKPTKSITPPEMKYYRIGPHGMLIVLDEELYALPPRTTNQLATSAMATNVTATSATMTAATASSSKNTANNIAKDKIKVRQIDIRTFKQLYTEKQTPTFASLLGKVPEKQSKKILPDTDPLNLLYESYSSDILIDKLIKFLPSHYNFDNITLAVNPAIKYKYNANQKPTSLEVEYINNPNFQAIYGITEFLRSYIDIYHDFLHYGTDIINDLKHTFETSQQGKDRYLGMVGEPLKSTLNTFYDKWMKIIDDNIFTNTVNRRVIQPKCHQIIEELTDAYIKLLHDEVGIKWMPTTKTNAFVGTYSLNSDCDIAKLVDQLRADGVNEFYVESANSHIGKSLQSHNMRVAMLDVGEWDAGSGYGSVKQGKVNTVIGKRVISKKPTNTSYEVLSAPTITLFGFIDVAVGNDYHAINIKNKADNNSIVTVNGDKDGYSRLALNRVAATLGLPIIRGQGEATKLSTTPDAKTLSHGQQQSIASLKTWTDFIQIRTFSELKSIPAIPKMAMVINDKCCETTARMNGLSCVLKNEGSNVTYYSYDIDSRQMSETTLKLKQKTLLQVLGHINKPENQPDLKKYIKQWFDVRIQTLDTIKSLVADPVLYFSSLLFSGIYQSRKENALNEIDKLRNKLRNKNINDLNELIKSFPTTVSEWLKSITNSEGIYSDFVNEIGNLRTIVNKISAAGSRDLKELIDYTDELKQIIVNSLGKLITNEKQLSVLVSTTLAFILFKKPRPDKYKTTFVSVITEMEKMKAKNDNKYTTDQIGIMKNSSTILDQLLEIIKINQIWEVHPSNFNLLNENNENPKPIDSFRGVYLTAPKEKISVLAHYQTDIENMKKDFNYGFEGIYNRAMCMLLENLELPPNLQSSSLCKKGKNENGSNTKKRKVTNGPKGPNSQQGGRYKLKTRKRSKYNK